MTYKILLLFRYHVVWVCDCLMAASCAIKDMFTMAFTNPWHSLHRTEAGGSDVNPDHEPHVPRGGITAEMQVCRPLSPP